MQTALQRQSSLRFKSYSVKINISKQASSILHLEEAYFYRIHIGLRWAVVTPLHQRLDRDRE